MVTEKDLEKVCDAGVTIGVNASIEMIQELLRTYFAHDGDAQYYGERFTAALRLLLDKNYPTRKRLTNIQS
jgi:lysozyme family protein